VGVPVFHDLLPSGRLAGGEEDQNDPSVLFCHQFAPANAC